MNVKIHWNKDAYGDTGLCFVLSLERLVEERLRVPPAASLSTVWWPSGSVNDEQLGLGRVEPVQGTVCGECEVDRGGRSPGGDGEFDVVGSEENDVRCWQDLRCEPGFP